MALSEAFALLAQDEVNGPLTAPSPELCVVQDADRQAPPEIPAT